MTANLTLEEGNANGSGNSNTMKAKQNMQTNMSEPVKSWRHSCLERLKMKSTTLDKICCFLAELLGCCILVFLGCMGCVHTDLFANSHLQTTLNFGLVILVAIQCFGCVSGAHLNPAVTVAAYVYDLVSLPMAFIYFVGQMLGGFIGYGLLKLLMPPEIIDVGNGLCVTEPHAIIGSLRGVGIEFVVTSVLIFVCCAVWDPRNAKHHDSTPIRFGLTVGCLAITAGPFTGASMNPARSFAPALWNSYFTYHWIYWVGPLAAGAVTSMAYKSVFRREVVVAETKDKLRALEEVPLS